MSVSRSKFLNVTFLSLTIMLFMVQDMYGQIRRREETTVRKEIDKALDNYLSEDGNVGLIIGIITDTASAIIPYGSVRKDTLITPRVDTYFEIGSLTKLFTSLTILEMEKSEKLSLNDPLSKFLPDSINAVNKNFNAITINDLLIHTSGLPKRPYNLNLVMKDRENPFSDYGLEHMMEYLSIYRLPSSLEKEPYKYSNLAYGLLGYIMSSVEGLSTEACIQKYCTGPLDLYKTKFTLEELESASLADGHMFNGEPAENWTYKSMETSSGLYSTASDLMTFMEYQLDADSSALSESILLSQQAQMPTNLKRISIGYGWHIVDRGRRYNNVYTHNGGTGGYRAYLAFIKESHTAVIVLSNSANRVDDIGIQILELINYGIY